ncbi:MAG: thioredoxin family protein [Polyangiaceae bacterium]|nr:thioredoxin family protein [Myxococcales bacterium]MCB9587059.1 thioredoxin family protein [Polyangiaceae bacterium]
MELLYYAGLAFIGGLILNVMPCVLPVLTLKLFHLVDHSENDARTNRMHGLSYTAGVILTFLALAGVLIGLKAAGHAVFYGKQFQNTTFLAVMVAVLVAFALNCFGVFEITVGLAGGEGREGYGGSFVNGILATILSTPCSAPIFGPAVAYALLKAPPSHTLVIFGVSGFGLALPFLLVTHIPALKRFLPKPGAWMDTFKQLLGFTLLATAAWLLGILMNKLPETSNTQFLYFLVVLCLALWAVGRFGNLMHSVGRRIGTRVAGTALVAAMAFWVVDLTPKSALNSAGGDLTAEANSAGLTPSPTSGTQGNGNVPKKDPPVVKNGHINWVTYDKARIDAEHKRQRPVFADFTAEWCVSCKANEKAVIETDGTRSLLTETNILPMKADMTDENPILEKEMQRLGRSGIPIYVIYFPDGSHKLLPEIITAEILHGALKEASERYPKDKYEPTTG